MVGFKTKIATPSIPKNPSEFRKKITAAARRTRNQIKRDFEKTTRTWKRKPVFKVSRKRRGGTYTFSAFTDDEIYGYVNNGTDPYTIVPKNAPALVFRYPSTPKTRPNVLRSGRGKRGSKWATKQEVKHPGIKARNFDKIIKKRFQDKWIDEVNTVLRDYLRTNTRPAGRFR